jgi:hypothetical protein
VTTFLVTTAAGGGGGMAACAEQELLAPPGDELDSAGAYDAHRPDSDSASLAGAYANMLPPRTNQETNHSPSGRPLDLSFPFK